MNSIRGWDHFLGSWGPTHSSGRKSRDEQPRWKTRSPQLIGLKDQGARKPNTSDDWVYWWPREQRQEKKYMRFGLPEELEGSNPTEFFRSKTPGARLWVGGGDLRMMFKSLLGLTLLRCCSGWVSLTHWDCVFEISKYVTHLLKGRTFCYTWKREKVNIAMLQETHLNDEEHLKLLWPSLFLLHPQ